MRFQVFVGALLIGTHQARVSRHIGGEDRGEATGRGHGSAGPLLQGFGSLNYTTIRASRYAADEPFRTSAVSFGPSLHQNGGYPTGSRIVEDLLKEAEPAIASTPDPAKTKNLLHLNRELLELHEPRPGDVDVRRAQSRVRAEVEAREMSTRNEAYHRARLAREK